LGRRRMNLGIAWIHSDERNQSDRACRNPMMAWNTPFRVWAIAAKLSQSPY
jgi:hypothetical protein